MNKKKLLTISTGATLLLGSLGLTTYHVAFADINYTVKQNNTSQSVKAPRHTDVKTVLEKTPPELASDIVDKGMVMTGGGSLIRNFPEMIAKHTNLKVHLAENPLESVVVGAGLALDQLGVLRKIEKAER